MEFSFTDARWLYPEEMYRENLNRNALGFHVPGRFDKIFHVEECLLMAPEHNAIRNRLHALAEQEHLSYFNPRSQTGYLRNVFIRNNRKGEWMITLVVGEPRREPAEKILDALCDAFPFITSAGYTINTKRNDSIADLEVTHYKGKPYLEEHLGSFRFRISPQSFFQTNATQAEKLYEVVKEFAGLTGNEILYDLYSGIGSIGIYLSGGAKKIVGLEYVEQATKDAAVNASENGITQAVFYAGDLKDLLKPELFAKEGSPDTIVADPPRSGMHPDVIEQIKQSGAHTLVYVSCNVATQARDLALLGPVYRPVLSQAVDMFPQTGHLENVVKLIRHN
jgi:23S rRNA (uracil1939-C5)-methyltransferase